MIEYGYQANAYISRADPHTCMHSSVVNDKDGIRNSLVSKDMEVNIINLG